MFDLYEDHEGELKHMTIKELNTYVKTIDAAIDRIHTKYTTSQKLITKKICQAYDPTPAGLTQVLRELQQKKQIETEAQHQMTVAMKYVRDQCLIVLSHKHQEHRMPVELMSIPQLVDRVAYIKRLIAKHNTNYLVPLERWYKELEVLRTIKRPTVNDLQDAQEVSDSIKKYNGMYQARKAGLEDKLHRATMRIMEVQRDVHAVVCASKAAEIMPAPSQLDIERLKKEVNAATKALHQANIDAAPTFNQLFAMFEKGVSEEESEAVWQEHERITNRVHSVQLRRDIAVAELEEAEKDLVGRDAAIRDANNDGLSEFSGWSGYR